MSNFDAIRAASINSAKVLKLDAEVGRFEVGYQADCVVLRSSPFDDLSAYSTPVATILGGTLVSTMVEKVLE